MAQRTAHSGLAMATLCLIFAGSAKADNSDYSVQYKIENETWVGANLDFDLGTNSVSVNGSVSHSSGTAMPMFGTCLYGESGALTCTASLGYGIGVDVVIGDGAVGSITFDPPEAEQRTYSNMSPELITEDRKRLFAAPDVSVVTPNPVTQTPGSPDSSGDNPGTDGTTTVDSANWMTIRSLEIRSDFVDGDQNCGVETATWRWRYIPETLTYHLEVQGNQSEAGCLSNMFCTIEWENSDGTNGTSPGQATLFTRVTGNTSLTFNAGHSIENKPVWVALSRCSIHD